MNWILIAISSHLVWAFGSIGDKFIIANKIKNPYIYCIWMFFVGGIGAILIPFFGLYIPTMEQFLWILLATVFEFAALFPYVKAVQMEDISRINVLWVLIPLFSLMMAYFTMGETLTNNQIIAFCMLIFGIVLASVKFGKGIVKFSKAFWWMALSCLGFAVYGTAVRHVSQEIGTINLFIYTHITGMLLAIPFFFFKKIRNIHTAEMKTFNLKTILIILAAIVIGIIGTLLNVWALSLGKVALVYAMEGFQAIFVFILVIVFALFIKVDLREDLDKRNVALKICALLINLAGIALLNI
ncbi:MAG: integral membrane protein [Candidatus Peregrinibacteria bacterium GW2011_GWC2_39_14]|nr:MAG: Conserved hypothetical membrane protein, DUF6 family [Candidatus Peregrinibacteria bacterium GW2011_GWA2_38_36]KKR07099.1 MAG: integral membrane protein [Candidatus Peregrinibacteria bacterium GW2011_GWC2_39_14]